MEPFQQPGLIETLAAIVKDMAHAMCQRPGENADQQFTRAKVATRAILSFEPRGTIEVMLAGHSVMFHALITDSIHHTLRGEIDTMRRGSRANIVALNKAFHLNVEKFAQYQTHPSVSADQAGHAVPAAADPAAAATNIPAPSASREAWTEAVTKAPAQVVGDAKSAEIPVKAAGDTRHSATAIDQMTPTHPVVTAGPPIRDNGQGATSTRCLPQHTGVPFTASPPPLNRAQRRHPR
jgi:hypothetical protein